MSTYQELAKILGVDRTIYGVQIVDQQEPGKLELFGSVRDMAGCVAAKILNFTGMIRSI